MDVDWVVRGAMLLGLAVLVVLLVRDRRRNRARDEVRTQQWRTAFRAANHGMDPPSWAGPPSALPSFSAPGSPAAGSPPVALLPASAPAPLIALAPPQVPTNTCAVLALVFGVLGGLISIPLGHVALSQIKRRGEGGRGAAVTGLVLGYLWLAGWLTLVGFAIAST